MTHSHIYIDTPLPKYRNRFISTVLYWFCKIFFKEKTYKCDIGYDIVSSISMPIPENLPPDDKIVILPVLAVVYSDGKDYSHLEANTDENPEHDECVYCGSNNQTITANADICHDCGEVYT